jgi:hypothetical protein
MTNDTQTPTQTPPAHSANEPVYNSDELMSLEYRVEAARLVA